MTTSHFHHRPRLAVDRSAFTRLDLLAVLAGAITVLLVSAPVWGSNRGRSVRASCVNNLRQIGLAMQLWGADHEDRPPQEVSVADGGTWQHELAPNVWVHCSWISNELRYAQVLFCPSDEGKAARDFSANPATGYIHPNFRNSATSYFLSHVHAGLGGYDILAGDRNLGRDAEVTCQVFRLANSVDVRFSAANFRWGTNMHGGKGQFLYFDGHVAELSNQGLLQEATTYKSDLDVLHFINHR